MKSALVLLFFSFHLMIGTTNYWSKTGHRVVGELAQQHLNRKAKRAVSKLLRGKSLASVSNYADEIKSDRAYKNFSPWHYVNIPSDKKYEEVNPGPNGDLVQGIQKCIDILRSETSSEADRIFYLKMLVHLIGDLHQPLHVGRKEDKGGNDIQVQWFNRGSNLHRVWDSHMIDYNGMSYTELTENLSTLDKKQKRKLEEGTLQDWVAESQALANKVYSSAGKGEKLGYSYSYEYWNTVEIQLQRGGLRLAKILNQIFG